MTFRHCGTAATVRRNLLTLIPSWKYGAADQYMTIADFAAYRKAQKLVSKSFAAKDDFTKKSLVNIARAGIFSADRSVEEYADKIWHL